jgi:two-component system sensor histidine kinase AtoS
LVTEVLDYARPLQLHFSPVDLVKLIEETIDLAAASSRMPTCQFSHALSTYIRSIDREKIQLVLLNLLKNAAEAKATTIGINLTADGMIYIKDNGIGIEEKNLKKIFTPFFTTKARGTGLGLAHALAIIKAHDGALEVQSENQKGTQITLKIYS